MAFVIKHSRAGKYLAKPGAATNYTSELDNARIFATRQAADSERLGSVETVAEISGLAPPEGKQ